MNILAIPTTYGFSKPISGGQNRFSNLIKALKGKDNRIILFESDSTVDKNDENIGKVYSYKDYKLLNRTLTIFREFNLFFIIELIKILRREKIDIIQVSHPSGIFIIKIITIILHNAIPIVYDSHNVESNFIMETFSNNKKYSKMERYFIPKYTEFIEKMICRYVANHIVAVSNEDKNIFIKKYNVKPDKICVIPSGCPISTLPDEKTIVNIKKEIGIGSDKFILFFHGLFSHTPNEEAFELIKNHIAPKFKEIDEKILFVVGGTDFPKFEEANIVSLGYIEDLYKILSIADMAIVPLKTGAGTKLKVLDYLSIGLPIVTTEKGSEGINIKNRCNAIITNDVNEDFINAIKYLIDNEQDRKRIGANARKLAEDEYDWEKIGEKIDHLYKEISEACSMQTNNPLLTVS